MTRSEMIIWLQEHGYVQKPTTFGFVRTLQFDSMRVKGKRCMLSLFSFKIEKKQERAIWETLLSGKLSDFTVGRSGSLLKCLCRAFP